ncbi:hypothetical protein CIK05_06280 [Bdellovibrio sp. qaytius]|nr:hypothetical protein CIK05_06280 [Bdellovibrio sp. qaytius]
MKSIKIAPLILGMIYSTSAFSQVIAQATPLAANMITAPTSVATVALTKEVLSSRSSVTLDVSNKYLRLLDKLLIAANAEGMQRDWFVNDERASILNSYAKSAGQSDLRNLSLSVAKKILLSLSQGYVQPEMLGDKTLRSLYEFKNYKNSVIQDEYKKARKAKNPNAESIRDAKMTAAFKKQTNDNVDSELIKLEGLVTENENATAEAEAIEGLIKKFSPKNVNYVRLHDMYVKMVDFKANATEAEKKSINLKVIYPPEELIKRKTKNDAPSILFVRNRLKLFGYSSAASGTAFEDNILNPEYTEDLRQAILALQDNNLLTLDGISGGQTNGILSTPIDQIITRIKINLDRSRWLPDDFKSEYVHVNLAAQRLFYYKDNKIALSFKTINGAKDRPTPILTTNITYMILNPTWTVAPTSYFKDKTKMFSSASGIKDVQEKRYTFKINNMNVINAYSAAYLASTGQEYPFMEVIRNNKLAIDDTLEVIFPNDDKQRTVNWPAFMQLFKDEAARMNAPGASIARLSPALTIVQRPGGDQNALGWIKFPLNDTNSIYMHDTNMRDLFNTPDRLLSSGCVRMEKPWDLALMLLGGSIDPVTGDVLDPADGKITRQMLFDRTKFRKGADGKDEVAPIPDPEISLKNPVPVYMLYDTAQINDHGQMTLVKDNYGIDMDMYNLMMGIAPVSAADPVAGQ